MNSNDAFQEEAGRDTVRDGGPRVWNRADVREAMEFCGVPNSTARTVLRLMEYVEGFKGRPAVAMDRAPLPAAEAGRVIRQVRAGLGLNQAEFAHRLGLKRHASVSDWERGHHLPPPRRLEQIAQMAGADAATLFAFGAVDGPATNPLPKSAGNGGEE